MCVCLSEKAESETEKTRCEQSKHELNLHPEWKLKWNMKGNKSEPTTVASGVFRVILNNICNPLNRPQARC